MRSARRGRAGSVIIECILLIPLIVMAAVCGVEFTRCLRYNKIAMSLSKEAANATFRECASVRTLQMSRCLHDLQESIEDFAQANINDGTTIRISVFFRTPNGWRDWAGGAPTADEITMAEDLVDTQDTVVVATASVRYRAIINVIARLFGTYGNEGIISDTTVL